MTTIIIPATVAEVDERCSAIEAVHMATGWERAAALASVVRVDNKPGPRVRGDSRELFTPNEYAKRGIPGLRDANTIRLYVQRWLDANAGRYPEPGTEVELPTTKWPPVDKNDAGSRLSTDPDKAVGQLVDKHGLGAVISGLEKREGPEKVAATIADEAPQTANHTSKEVRERAEAAVAATTKERTGSTEGFKPTPDERLLERAREQDRWLSDMASCARALCNAYDDGLLIESTALALVGGIHGEALDRLTALRFELAPAFAARYPQ